ncbi:hypothetical protein VTN00DRAFT_6058 [Thermoascus crustaceus]|uniref:uncharacterized protein n=1 Tax=Thermoascus crustaceus TaxID=5088 RepID=UPI0037435C91
MPDTPGLLHGGNRGPWTECRPRGPEPCALQGWGCTEAILETLSRCSDSWRGTAMCQSQRSFYFRGDNKPIIARLSKPEIHDSASQRPAPKASARPRWRLALPPLSRRRFGNIEDLIRPTLRSINSSLFLVAWKLGDYRCFFWSGKELATQPAAVGLLCEKKEKTLSSGTSFPMPRMSRYI